FIIPTPLPTSTLFHYTTLFRSSLLSFEKPGEMEQYIQQVASQNNISPENPQVQQRVQQYINTRLKPDRKELASSDAIRYLILSLDRKSTRLNSSHVSISYAVFC